MQSSSRQRPNPNFWIPPDTLYESAEPIATRTPEPATPTRAATRTGPSTTPLRASASTRPPPLPLSSQRTAFTAGPSTTIAASAPQRPPAVPRHSRAGKEFNRRERKFETLFDQWTKKMAELEEEHRLVTLTCTNEEQSKTAMDDFNRKAQDVFTRFNDQIEALQMSSSEPGSSQSEASEDDDEEENANEDAEDIMAGPTPIRSRLDQDDVDDEDDDDDDDEEEEDEEEEDEEEDAEEGDDIEGDRASTPPSEIESGDDTDHSARKSTRSKGYQSSEVSTGSLGIHTPPPTEVDEDWRATRRRQAREQRKADELASALPQRLRSGTLRGASPASSAASSVPISAPPRPAAMSLFETLSSSPASASSMQASPYNASRRPSRDVSVHSTADPDPNQTTSRIDFLRRQNSLSGSDRSLSRPRQPSPSPSPITVLDESRLFRDQFDNWRNMARERSDHWIRKAEQQTEDSKSIYYKEQEEKHKRAQQLFIAHQDKLLQQYSRNRSGSTGQGSAATNSPVNGFHARTGSFVASSSPHVMGPTASPTASRHGPASSSPVANRPLNSSVSQTFHFAGTHSQSPPSQQGHSQSPSHPQTRSWVPSQTGLSSGHSAKLNHASSSDSEPDNEAVDEEESDIGPIQTHNGTPPISIPNSNRGSFDHGHRRTQTQVFTGTPGAVGSVGGAPSTPRNNFPQPQSQHLRNSSSTTFSSSGTASTRSSGGWSGASGTSSNTTVTSSDTPGSRRGSISDKSFVIPINLHDHRKPTLPLPTGTGASPPNAQAQPRWNLDGGSATHSPASTLSRSSTLPLSAGTSTGSSRPTAQQWQAMLSSSPSAPPVVTTTNGSATTSTASASASSSTRPVPTSINLGQSPSKTAWKAVGQPSPPIPTQTRPVNVALPPQWTRSDSSSTLSSSPSFASSFATPKPSPPLRSVMSNSDMASSSASGSTLKIRSSVASFAMAAATEEGKEVLERPSRSMSPTKPALIPAKAAPSPPTVTSTSTDTATADKGPESEPVLHPLRKESKKKVKARERQKAEEEEKRKKAEEEERRKRAEEEEQRRKAEEDEAARKAEEERQKEQAAREEEERLQREREAEERRKKEREEETRRQEKRAEEERRKRERQEAEKLRKQRLEEERRRKREEDERLRKEREEQERLEKERQEEELRLMHESEELERQKKHEDEVRRREEALKKKEEEIRRREEELERTRKEEELQRKEAELRKREEAVRRQEEEIRRQREERLKENKEEVAEPESSPTQSQPSSSNLSSSSPQNRKVDQKKRKKARDEQKEREAALARQQAEEEDRRREEERLQEERLREEEELRIEEEKRLAEQEERLRREQEDEESAKALAAALEAERLETERMEAEHAKQQRLKEELRRQEAAALEEMNRRRMAHKQREDEQRQAQARRDREEAIRLQREEDERQAQWQEQRRRYEEEQRRHRTSRADEERRQEEEQRRQEERIRQENDRLTEMFKAKERTQQMSTNMPKRYSDAWEAYNAKWKSLLSSNSSEERPVLTFATVPWPTLTPPSGPEAITRNVVGGFVLSQWHSREKSRRDRIREALLRWHPDRFESRYLSMVPEGEEKENVRAGVGNVARSLNELLTAESSTGHL